MGADGCIKAYSTQATQKQGRGREFLVFPDRIWELWPGKFPRTWCLWVLTKMTKNGCRWVLMHTDGCNGAYRHGEEKKQGKKSWKWASRTCFQRHVHVQKPSVSQGWLRGGREDKGWKISIKLGVHRDAVDTYTNYTTQLPNSIKKKAKQVSANWCKPPISAAKNARTWPSGKNIKKS